MLEVRKKESLIKRQCSGNQIVNFEIFHVLNIVLLRCLFFPGKPPAGPCKPSTTYNYLLHLQIKLQYRGPQIAFPSVAFYSVSEF